MTQPKNVIKLHYSDPEINSVLKRLQPGAPEYTKHFNQNEQFFLKIQKRITFPGLPIHHDVKQVRPKESYLENVLNIVQSVGEALPDVFSGLTYFFNPGEVLKPSFFQLYKVGDTHYVYLLKLDINYRTHDSELVKQGGNDHTPTYATNKIYLEGQFIPLSSTNIVDGKTAGFEVDQIVSQTWIGETGRGYFVQGIWMDHELTKFFTKLFQPQGKRMYPYYPFTCQYQTMCHQLINLDPEGRKKHLPILHRGLRFVKPNIRHIENALKAKNFSADIPVFKKLKDAVPEYWSGVWDNIEVSAYLNGSDMKEYLIDTQSN